MLKGLCDRMPEVAGVLESLHDNVQRAYRRAVWLNRHRVLARIWDMSLWAAVWVYSWFQGPIPRKVFRWVKERGVELKAARDPESWRKKAEQEALLGFFMSMAFPVGPLIHRYTAGRK